MRWIFWAVFSAKCHANENLWWLIIRVHEYATRNWPLVCKLIAFSHTISHSRTCMEKNVHFCAHFQILVGHILITLRSCCIAEKICPLYMKSTKHAPANKVSCNDRGMFGACAGTCCLLQEILATRDRKMSGALVGTTHSRICEWAYFERNHQTFLNQ